MRLRPLALLSILGCALSGLAQDRPPVSPGVGNAVLLATNSIQLDRDVVIETGDVIVNAASPGPVLGEHELSIDSNARTPAGFRIAANGIDLDHGAFIGGDAHFNHLSNDRGTIAGQQFTPLALPVYGSLPPPLQRSSGFTDVVVADHTTVELDEDAYGSLTVGRNATVIFTGGGYAFTSISTSRNTALLFSGPSTVVVNGRMSIGRESTVGPAGGSGLSPSSIQLFVHGVNGLSGGLAAVPPAAGIGERTAVAANLHASAGSLVFDRDGTAVGAFFALDIKVGRACRIALASASNNPPTADAKTVFTDGASPLTITLTGADPEGGALTFTIVSGPTAGTLSAVTPTTASSATVVYTPSSGGNVSDAFTFSVTDPAGASGSAVVTINPALDDPPPPPPATVVANDSSATVFTAAPVILGLTADAPDGVGVTFSIVSGPSHGTLSAVTQGTESPQRTASVEYTSDAGYTGTDAFEFQACGIVNGSNACDTATVSLVVAEAPSDVGDDIVGDVSVATPAGDDIVISLSGNGLDENSRTFILRPHAAALDPAEIAGNVADADENGLGDNHNDLSSGVPVVMSAGVNGSGGPGSNGTRRMHFEWDVSSFGLGSSLVTAQVVLTTHRGTIDSLDTFFYSAALSGDGQLTDSDFEIDAEQIPGVVMHVPSTTEMPVGTDGTFSFDVLAELKSALAAGHTQFVIQGRVDESVPTTARGLEVYTSVAANVTGGKVPMLSLTTPGVTAPIVYSILSLPANGTLFDGTTQITSVPYTLSASNVRYEPAASYVGPDSFQFQGALGDTIDEAVVNIVVFLGNCATDPRFCEDGR